MKFELASNTLHRTKFNYVVPQLKQQQAVEMENIIDSPAEQDTYDRLKAELFITLQRTKFNYVVSKLNQQQADELEDIITTPPLQKPYDRIQAELLRRLFNSREQRVRQLLSHEQMGDRVFWSLATHVPNDFLRSIWANLFPPHVQTILADHTEGNLHLASQVEDRICEITPCLP